MKRRFAPVPLHVNRNRSFYRDANYRNEFANHGFDVNAPVTHDTVRPRITGFPSEQCNKRTRVVRVPSSKQPVDRLFNGFTCINCSSSWGCRVDTGAGAGGFKAIVEA